MFREIYIFIKIQVGNGLEKQLDFFKKYFIQINIYTYILAVLSNYNANTTYKSKSEKI